MRRPLLRPVAQTLLVALVPLALHGCVSIGVSRAALEHPPGSSAPPTGTLVVSVFEKAARRGEGGREGSGKVSTSFLVPVVGE